MITVDDTPALDFKRDRWGRPLIVPANGGKAIPYTRSSSAAKTIEDTYNLELWARRNGVFGMARDASLTARVLAIGGDPSTWDLEQKKAVNLIAEDAQKVAQAHKAADIGSAVHKLTERLDRGEIVTAGPFEADLQAYVNACIAAGLTIREVECRMVCDSLEMAGTADRIVVDAMGQFRIADLKTGESVNYGGLGWAAQLAAYAHGELYDVTTDQRIATPKLDREVGYIIHLPAGRGECTIYEVNLAAGYHAAQLANEIRAVRKASKTWISKLDVGACPPAAPATTPEGVLPTGESESPAPAPPAGAGDSTGRRARLLGRYRALSDDDKRRFIARQAEIPRYPGDRDLDAMERLLDEIDPFSGLNSLTPTYSAIQANRRLGDVGLRDVKVRKPVTLEDLDCGEPMEDDEFEFLRSEVALLEPMRQSWLRNVIATAGGAGVAIKATHRRSYDLLRGLVCLARDGHDDDQLVRELAATALESDEPFYATTVGQAVGILAAPTAARFAVLCVALCDDVASVDLRTQPVAS